RPFPTRRSSDLILLRKGPRTGPPGRPRDPARPRTAAHLEPLYAPLPERADRQDDPRPAHRGHGGKAELRGAPEPRDLRPCDGLRGVPRRRLSLPRGPRRRRLDPGGEE